MPVVRSLCKRRVQDLEKVDLLGPDNTLGPLRVAEALAHDTGLRSKALVRRKVKDIVQSRWEFCKVRTLVMGQIERG